MADPRVARRVAASRPSIAGASVTVRKTGVACAAVFAGSCHTMRPMPTPAPATRTIPKATIKATLVPDPAADMRSGQPRGGLVVMLASLIRGRNPNPPTKSGRDVTSDAPRGPSPNRGRSEGDHMPDGRMPNSGSAGPSGDAGGSVADLGGRGALPSPRGAPDGRRGAERRGGSAARRSSHQGSCSLDGRSRNRTTGAAKDQC